MKKFPREQGKALKHGGGTFAALRRSLAMPDTSSAATAEADVEKLRRHVRILVELGRLAGHDSTPERFLDHAVVQVGRAVEIHHVKVLRYRPTTADLLMVAGTGWKEGLVRSATFSSDLRSPPGRSYRTAEPVCIADFTKATDFVVSEVLKEHGIVSLANVPILTDGAAWGVLEVDSTTPRDFTSDTVEFMIAAAAGTSPSTVASTNQPFLSPAGRPPPVSTLAPSRPAPSRTRRYRSSSRLDPSGPMSTLSRPLPTLRFLA